MSEFFVISQSVKRRLQNEIEKSAQFANNEFKTMSEGFVIYCGYPCLISVDSYHPNGN